MANFSLSKTIWVNTNAHKYPIYIGKQLEDKAKLLSNFDSDKIFIVTDNNVGPLYLSGLVSILPSSKIETYSVPAGENNKSLTSWTDILSCMLEKKLNRDSIVIALGGGMIGDLAGFAASCFQRGISFIQIPTTLLAQVDASIGGKTAINFNGEKNVIGSFHQPKAVFIDPCMLKTLPQREYISGLAEVIKYALLGDFEFFEWLTLNLPNILEKSSRHIYYLLSKCCSAKASIVEQDEKEHGMRVLLNLGHTFAHALESVTLYKRWLHGEAVAIGLYCQALLSGNLGYLQQSDVDKIKKLLTQAGLPCYIPKELDIDLLVDFMWRDKKVLKSKLRLIVLRSVGCAQVEWVSDLSLIKAVLESARDV